MLRDLKLAWVRNSRLIVEPKWRSRAKSASMWNDHVSSLRFNFAGGVRILRDEFYVP